MVLKTQVAKTEAFEPTSRLTIKQICHRFDIEEWKVRVWIREGRIVACGTRPSPKGGAPLNIFHEADVLAVLKITHGKSSTRGEDKEREKAHDALMRELAEESQLESARYEKWFIQFSNKLEGKK